MRRNGFCWPARGGQWGKLEELEEGTTRGKKPGLPWLMVEIDLPFSLCQPSSQLRWPEPSGSRMQFVHLTGWLAENREIVIHLFIRSRNSHSSIAQWSKISKGAASRHEDIDLCGCWMLDAGCCFDGWMVMPRQRIKARVLVLVDVNVKNTTSASQHTMEAEPHTSVDMGRRFFENSDKKPQPTDGDWPSSPTRQLCDMQWDRV